MSGRRSASALTAVIETATDNPQRARAHFDLAVFHDNNSREAEAISHYRRAIQLGLPKAKQAQAWAWLSSSLLKTGQGADALDAVLVAERLAEGDAALARLIHRLKRRLAPT